MKLFCSTCRIEATDNIHVYENVDGFMIHCADCNEPLVLLGFDEREKLGVLGYGSDASEDQLNLFDDCKCPDQELKEESMCDCDCCSGAEEDYSQVQFTVSDLEIISKALYSKVLQRKKSYEATASVLDKVTAILGICPCQ